jgi:hypothetical protein
VHRTRAPLRLRPICDVAELLRRERSLLDWDAIGARAAATGARTALYSVLLLAERLLGASVPATVLAGTGVGPLRRRVLGRACGAAAIFRPETSGTIGRQVGAGLRAFEHDGVGTIARSLGDRASKKGDRLLERGRNASSAPVS